MKILVLGGAVSGLAAARLAHSRGHQATIYDADTARVAAALREGFATVAGSWSADVLAGVDLVVTSPGFPERSLPIVETLESGVPLESELEFGWRHLDCPVAGVTGTNGKTTTTQAAAEMLEMTGCRSAAVGNVGYAISDAALHSWDSLVVEASSFQLRFSDTFHPKAAALLNIAPDHFDWHGSFPSYQAAKQKIFQNQTSDDLLVFDADDPGAQRAVANAPSRVLTVSAKHRNEGGWGVEDEALHLPGIRVAVDEMATNDPSFLVDLAAAGLLALELGAGPEAVTQCLRNFQPGAHRRRTVAVINGVGYVDDSKATNPHSALSAVAAFPSVVLIAGGLAKGLDVAPLAQAANLRYLVAIGEAAPVLLAAARVPAVAVATLEAAVQAAAKVANPGDVVLLAPGCASFDMFSDYAHRGDEFIRLVNGLTVGVAQ